jgi:hypothetical protein
MMPPPSFFRKKKPPGHENDVISCPDSVRDVFSVDSSVTHFEPMRKRLKRKSVSAPLARRAAGGYNGEK